LEVCFTSPIQKMCGHNINCLLIRNTEIAFIFHNQTVPTASQSKARTVFDRLNTGIVGSNPARGMDVCPRLSVLCCPV